ncbi:hypothetical protein GQ457_01G013920 [Hibiscus cannabinus]
MASLQRNIHVHTVHPYVREHVRLGVEWVLSVEGVLKFNVDGAATGKPVLAGCGGFICNWESCILALFSGLIGVADSNETELQAIFHSLVLLGRLISKGSEWREANSFVDVLAKSRVDRRSWLRVLKCSFSSCSNLFKTSDLTDQSPFCRGTRKITQFCKICPAKLKRRRFSCSTKISQHSSILEVGKINILTLSTDEGQDDTGPTILKSREKINVLTLSTDEGQDDTGPANLKRWRDYPTLLR